MSRFVVGVHVTSEPARLTATLAALRACSPEARVVLLADGPERDAADAIARLDLETLRFDEPRGAAACFNRLAAAGGDDAIVFLESGAIVSRGWLARLSAALADPATGLAGPSTNRAWNEQRARPDADPANVEAAAAEVARRFGDVVRPLAPLHSLGDFCYAVRRDVLRAVGGADEGYGRGPCWEMDLNIRAARTGFRSVWVCGAFVYRAPPTARRVRDEARLFEASKRRYQDRFCAQRVRGERTAYEPHCKGDECADFAVAGLLALGATPVARVEVAPVAAAPVARIQVVSSGPLVSCIMPTFDRRAFVPRALRCFAAQDYANRELVIVDDGTDPVADLVPRDERVRYLRLDARATIGHKRNLACRAAAGDVIVHWDDDDWYPPDRVARQVAALDGAELSGTSRLYYHDADAGRAFLYEYPNPRRWVAGNTLAYRKAVWQRAPFADIQIGEDARFLRTSDGRVADLADPSLCVAALHAGNASPKRTSQAFWRAVPLETITRLLAEPPLVSCIMPTFNRRPFLPLAIENFRRQDHPAKELIIVDDGSDPVEDLVRGLDGVRYLRLQRRATIGGKRNLAWREARGAIIAQWDDDDWYGPSRLTRQIAPIVAGEADMSGLVSRWVLELPGGEFWSVEPQLHRRMFVGDVHGGTLVFRRSLINEGLAYPEADLAEDAELVRQLQRRGGRLAKVENDGAFVYVRHGHNAWRFRSGQFLDPSGWKRTAPPAEFSVDAIASYRAAARGGR